MGYCSKGKILNSLGRDQEALECLNKADELAQNNLLEGNLSEENMNYIQKTLNKDRAKLLHKLAQLQQETLAVGGLVKKLTMDNQNAKDSLTLKGLQFS